MIGIKFICIFFFVSYGTTTVIDDDAERTTCEIAVVKGYPCEIHRLATADGYILEIHRLLRGKKSPSSSNVMKKVIFLQHGLEDSSATWVINMETQSLGFIAADANLDVWMGNVRGNVYCRNHFTLTALDPMFWRFTFNEMAKYDLPAMINYVLNYTKQQSLYYVGHSQGTQIGFIQFSEDPSWAKDKIKQFHALAPVAWLGHSTSPIRTFAPLVASTARLFPSSGLTQFNPDNYFAAAWGALSCNLISCTNYAARMSSSDLSHCNKSRNSVYNAKIPSGTSTLNIWHDIQLMLDGRFETYGDNPLPYHPETSVVPTYLYWSNNDAFTHADDVAILKNSLRTVVKEYRNDTYNHIDFVWSLYAAQDIYSQIINSIITSL